MKKKMVKVEIDLSDDVLLKLCLMAHEHDITLNKMVEKILKDYLKGVKKNAND